MKEEMIGYTTKHNIHIDVIKVETEYGIFHKAIYIAGNDIITGYSRDKGMAMKILLTKLSEHFLKLP